MIRKSRLLIVEDDSKISTFLKIAFEREEFDTFIAENGIDAMKMVLKHDPDIILLDILMPKKNGLEFLKDLRADSKYIDIPVVILSCQDALHQIRNGMEAGATDYITKPVFTEDIVAKILELCPR